MNLYRCTCNKGGSSFDATLDVMVMADDPLVAAKKAIEKMRELSYIYNSYVSNIELIASEDLYKKMLLVR